MRSWVLLLLVAIVPMGSIWIFHADGYPCICVVQPGMHPQHKAICRLGYGWILDSGWLFDAGAPESLLFLTKPQPLPPRCSLTTTELLEEARRRWGESPPPTLMALGGIPQAISWTLFWSHENPLILFYAALTLATSPGGILLGALYLVQRWWRWLHTWS